MKKKVLKGLRILAFFMVGVVIFWLVYKDQDFSRIKSILKNDVNYFWIWVSLFIGLLSHVSRTLRWRLMIEPLGHKPGITNTFLAVMVGYLMNLALPRMGEVSRCGVLSRYERISFTKLIGTVVVERLVDVIMLLLLLLIVIFSQFGQVVRFLNNNPAIKEKLEGIAYSPVLIISMVLVIALLIIFRKRILETALLQKVASVLSKFAEGLKSIGKMKNKGVFIFHSVFIWLMYYVMLYVVFFSFDFTSHLSAMAGLTTFVLGSFGMVAPVQGGFGAWHFMVIESLVIYGIDKSNGTIFALLAHTSMTAMIIIVGFISLLLLPFMNRRKVGENIQ